MTKSRLALLCLAVCTLPGVAQAAPDPARGKQLFEDTPNVEGVADTITGTCTNCHGSVQDRRRSISGTSSTTAYVAYDTALNHLGSAVGMVSQMSQFRALCATQLEDLAAYISDVPTATVDGVVGPEEVTFTASAVGNAVTKTVTVTHSTTATENLRINSVSLGATPNGFATSSSCTNTVLAPAASCTFSVTYTPTSTTTRQLGLVTTMHEGTSTTATTRTVQLKGTVAGAPAPAPAPPPAPAPSDSGGGALGWSWLVGLSLGTAALLANRRRSAR